MKVSVERTLTGFSLTMPCGARESIRYDDAQGNWWCRYYAAQALNMISNLYRVRRRSIRFDH
jgi:hypothetical protein